MAYDIAWVQDKDSPVDTINGFIEVYMDPRGMKGSWEALVFYVNPEKTEGIRKLAADAQWFEDRMPWAAQYRKQGVRGITANAIDVVIETGDSGPITPVGINLPNDQEIREKYGSKSVSLSNVNEAYDKSTSAEFRASSRGRRRKPRARRSGAALAGELTTEHARGHRPRLGQDFRAAERQPADGAEGAVLGARGGARRSRRAVFPARPEAGRARAASSADDQHEIVRAEYEGYARNALVQLRRIREGTQIEEDHMRNRQMIVRWLMANSKAIDVRERDGKTYYVMVDAKAFQEGVGRLLAEVQRIKAEGDYEAAKKLFETYGVHFDAKLRDEVVARVDQLNMPSYTGFVQPRLEAVKGADGKITDVKISYPMDLTTQMLEYSGKRQMKRASVAAVILVSCLESAGAAQPPRPRRQPPAVSGLPPAAAQMAILAAEDSRLVLPDDLHTPAIDTLRAKQMEDVRLLLELARSKDAAIHMGAVRALGRLERREVIPDLLPYLITGPIGETANAIAQAFHGPPLPGDTGGEQVERALEALASAGAIPMDPARRPGPIGQVALAIGRLPYERAEQVQSAESYLLRMMGRPILIRCFGRRFRTSRAPLRCWCGCAAGFRS